MFPEDNYGAGVEYQDDGPQPEDKVWLALKQYWLKNGNCFSEI